MNIFVRQGGEEKRDLGMSSKQYLYKYLVLIHGTAVRPMASQAVGCEFKPRLVPLRLNLKFATRFTGKENMERKFAQALADLHSYSNRSQNVIQISKLSIGSYVCQPVCHRSSLATFPYCISFFNCDI